MKRSARFLAFVALSALVTVLLCTSSESSGGTCQDKLVGNSYDCTYAFNSGQSGVGGGSITKHNCAKFVTGGLSENFDLVSLGFPVDLGCACQTTDTRIFSFTISANTFECVGDSAGNLVQFHGKINSNRLHGQASEEGGVYIVFDCKKLSMACM
jgi:hypothetical protein